MGQLLFKKCFWEAIRRGSKRTTVRRWTWARVRAGQRAFAPGLGWLMIEAVNIVDLEELDDADARADGFESLRQMKQALRRLYPGHARGDGRRWFRVAFRCDGEERDNGDDQKPAAEPLGSRSRARAQTSTSSVESRVRRG